MDREEPMNRSEDLRDIESILLFRNDISPFLVHLTRDTENVSRENLNSILDSMYLKYGVEPFSDASYGFSPYDLTPEIKSKFFSAISFTETPLAEIHNLLNIADRRVDLKPYGLVFIKARLKSKGVSPVIYINNKKGDKNEAIRALCTLIDTHPEEASEILPLVAVFGKYFRPVVGRARGDEIDFTWEREWRYTSKLQKFTFDQSDVFIGLCPNDEIKAFENKFKWLKFVDPMRNMKWYADKLVRARKQYDLQYSVV